MSGALSVPIVFFFGAPGRLCFAIIAFSRFLHGLFPINFITKFYKNGSSLKTEILNCYFIFAIKNRHYD